MKKFVALLTKEETETAMNEWENEDLYTLHTMLGLMVFMHAFCCMCIENLMKGPG